MATHPCATCGRQVNPSIRCPYCGTENPLDEELARIERSIAEMSARDMALLKERSQLSSKMQAALFQRDILAHANQERLKRSAKAGRAKRRRVPPVNGGMRPPWTPPEGGGTLLDDPPRDDPGPPRRPSRPDGAPPDVDPPDTAPDAVTPEASSRSVQNILLALGALLLAVSAVVFAAVAISSLQAVGRSAILAVATAIALAVAPVVVRRGLTSTAETIASVGLMLVPMALYALHGIPALGGDAVSDRVFLAFSFAVTAGVAFGYAGGTRLAAPRYATVLALQPVLPLAAYDRVEGPAGWSLVLTAVAALDVVLAGTIARRGRLLPRWPEGRPTAADAPTTEPAAEPGRPESAPEEPDLVLDFGQATEAPRRRRRIRFFPGPRPAGSAVPGAPAAPGPLPPSASWLREVLLTLVAVAVAGGLAYAVAALLRAADAGAAGRGATVLLLAALTGLTGAWLARNGTAEQVAGGVLTLAVIGGAARVAAVAVPDRALLITALVVALTGVVVRLLPADSRRGPQLASAAALTVIGIVVAADVLRAAVAPLRAAVPAWQADVGAYQERIAGAAGTAGWQLAIAALLLTVAAALALPAGIRHEAAVAGVALTALSVPASFQLPWSQAPWPLVVAAIALGASGLMARTHRAAVAHLIAAGVVGLFGAGASVAQPWLTGAVLTALAGAGIMVTAVARQLPTHLYAWLVGDWAAGGAAFALPGAVAAGGVSVADPTGAGADPGATVPVLAASFLAVAATLSVAAVTQVARREISQPLTLGTGLGALAVTLAAFTADGSTAPDMWVGALLVVAAVLLFLAPSIDAGGRSDRLLDGPDIAAAAATVAVIGALARVASLLFPAGELVATAAVVLIVAAGARAMPLDWRRGPVVGTALGGGLIGLIAGYTALRGGLRALTAPGPLWNSDLNAWPTAAPPGAWQAPVALVLLAIAATAVLPRPAGYDAAAVCVGLATVGAPAALGLPWWSPMVVGGAVTIAYGVASVAARDPRAAVARAAVAAGVALHATGAGLVRPWTTAAVLALITVVGVVVALLARMVAPVIRAEAPAAGRPPRPVDLAVDDTGLPRHLGQIGGAATAGALLALPGVFAGLTAQTGKPAQVVLTAALAASSVSLAVVTLLGGRIPQYLPYATVGLVGGATVTALASLPTDHPTALYAAAAALLGIVAELLRGATSPPSVAAPPTRRWSYDATGGGSWTPLRPAGIRGWSVSPTTGAVAVAALPTALALASITPVLVAALVDPFQTLNQIWQGAPAVLLDPVPGRQVDGTSVLAAVLLTVAAALAAVGFTGGRPAHSVPVVLPGLAITLLITPVALDQPWPAATMAALTVFTISMLGLALTPPPLDERATLLRATRNVVFAIGLAAGGAGLAGSLATRELTLFTLGSAVGVGVTAALAGRSQPARILGWLFASTFGQLFVLTAGLVAGLDTAWSAFGVLAVGAALLLVEATLPRLRLPESSREASAVEWSGYAAALLAVALAYDSPRHVAALMAAWGAVLGVAATRPGRPAAERRVMFWLSVGFEVGAWWLLMRLSDVALPEAYTLPFAAMALLVGVLESRHRPDLSSWVAYGPALLAAFVPTVVIVLSTDASDLRQVLLLLGAVATLIAGSRWRQQAPVVVGALVTAIAALHFTVTLVGPWLVLIPVGVVLVALGASDENRRRTQQKVRGALTGMR